MIHDRNAIRESVRQRFSRVACDPRSERRFPVGAASAKALGYPAADIDALPPPVSESFAGVGNPLALGHFSSGQSVLDVGCGAGLDSVLAARCVGLSGKVIGVDYTREMIEKARSNAALAGAQNVEFIQADVESLPLADASVDVVITNGVFNLCVDKPRVLKEIHRVLRPGGRLQMADILLEDHVSPEAVSRKGEWSD